MLKLLGGIALAAVLLLACSSTSTSTGTMTGRMATIGGPAPGINQGTAGTVTAVRTNGPGIISVATGPGTGRLELPKGHRYLAKAGSGGRFTLDLPPGRYAVAGNPTHSNGFCTADGVVTIRRGQTTQAQVICSIP